MPDQNFKTKKIAIIGFGFCGRIAFYHLSKQKNISITIFEKSGIEFIGAAFSKFSPNYLLNVPAIKMSAFSEKPNDFYDFLSQHYSHLKIAPNDFAPRWLYGEYLKKITEEAFLNAKKNNLKVQFAAQEVLKISKKNETEFDIFTKDNSRHEASKILIASSFLQANIKQNFSSEKIINNLWQKESMNFHRQNCTSKNIAIIGSGLTAVDIALGLAAKKFSGKITIISRRGNLPKEHFKPITNLPNFINAQDGKNGVLFLCQKIRNFLQQNQEFDLRHVVDSLRQITSDLWQNFDKKNKKLFWKLMPYWNIFRHRVPQSSLAKINKMIESGHLEIRKNGISSISEISGKIFINSGAEILQFDQVINCLGFDFSLEKYPLFKEMIEENILKPDFVLIASNHPSIHLLGGLNIAQSLEITSVPDMKKNIEEAINKI